jgi:hypothetical protein
MWWYGKEVQIFAGLFPKFNTYSLLESYESVQIFNYVCKHKLWPKNMATGVTLDGL